ncbi:hypothetical protein, partial [Enhygromyxa salina]|uniref:hypothetical protein n=1 Tax=Enhygromyxa salina TaxID=215803 RepID=UPI0015E5BFB2
MLFDPKYAARVRGAEPLAELGGRERELLRGVDPRALGTDDMRRARALRVILDEYPVSAALLGIEFVERFFSSAEFRACVFERGSMALAFGGRYLRDRAKGVGVLETAMARARRRGRPRVAGVGCAVGLVPVRVPDGTLAWYQRARRRLGSEPLAALAKLRRPWANKPPRRGREHLLVEVQGDGSLSIGTASEGLVGLLIAADPPRARGELLGVAIELGAEVGEAEEVLDGLIGDGLL